MTKKRRIKDFLANLMTYLTSGIATLMLLMIFLFIFKTGFSTLNWQMITGNYNSENILLQFPQDQSGSYTAPESLSAGMAYSTKYGVVFEDYTNHEKKQQVLIVSIEPNSPFQQATDTTNSSGDTVTIVKDAVLQKIVYINAEGEEVSAGPIVGQDAQQLVDVLDQQSVSLKTIYYQTQGGGIFGSLKATLMLIGITLLLAMPLGIGAAIYLHELAPKNRFTEWMRSSIEMLSGVPSVVFGLMGISVLFPVTALFGIHTLSVLLGAMTMSVILLPVIIRATEEALMVVPESYRDGSLSLGATQTQTIMRIILPAAMPGILSAGLLSISRTIGESAALIFTMGTFINDHPSLRDKATSLAVQIWSVMSGEQPNFELASAISIIILVIVLILNIGTKLISRRLMKKWSA